MRGGQARTIGWCQQGTPPRPHQRGSIDVIESIFIPADNNRPPMRKTLRRDQLLQQLYLLIGCNLVEAIDLGHYNLIVDEEALLTHDPRFNLRATLAYHAASPIAFVPLFGDVVMVGPTDYDGEWTSIDADTTKVVLMMDMTL